MSVTTLGAHRDHVPLYSVVTNVNDLVQKIAQSVRGSKAPFGVNRNSDYSKYLENKSTGRIFLSLIGSLTVIGSLFILAYDEYDAKKCKQEISKMNARQNIVTYLKGGSSQRRVDKGVMLKALEVGGQRTLTENLNQSKDLALKVVSVCGHAIRYMENHLQDRDVVEKAGTLNPYIFLSTNILKDDAVLEKVALNRMVEPRGIKTIADRRNFVKGTKWEKYVNKDGNIELRIDSEEQNPSAERLKELQAEMRELCVGARGLCAEMDELSLKVGADHCQCSSH